MFGALDDTERAFAVAGLLPVTNAKVEGDTLTAFTEDGKHLLWASLDGDVGDGVRAMAIRERGNLMLPWVTLIEIDAEMADIENPEHLEIAQTSGVWRGFPEIVATVEDTYALWMHIVQPLEGEVLHIGVRPDLGDITDDALAQTGLSLLMERASGIAPPLLTVPWDDAVAAVIFGEVGE